MCFRILCINWQLTMITMLCRSKNVRYFLINYGFQVSRGPQSSAVPAHLVDDLWNNNKKTTTNVRQHSFQNKMLVMPERCGSCNKKVGFGKTVAKCSNCHSICHLHCINLLSDVSDGNNL